MLNQLERHLNILTLFEVSIPGRTIVKKNTKRFSVNMHNRAPKIYYSPQYYDWSAAAKTSILKAKQKYPSLIDTNVEVHFEFHYKNHQWEADTSNLIEGPQDVLVEMGVLKDDKLITKLIAEKIFDGEEKCVVKVYGYSADCKTENVPTDKLTKSS